MGRGELRRSLSLVCFLASCAAKSHECGKMGHIRAQSGRRRPGEGGYELGELSRSTNREAEAEAIIDWLSEFLWQVDPRFRS